MREEEVVLFEGLQKKFSAQKFIAKNVSRHMQYRHADRSKKLTGRDVSLFAQQHPKGELPSEALALMQSWSSLHEDSCTPKKITPTVEWRALSRRLQSSALRVGSISTISYRQGQTVHCLYLDLANCSRPGLACFPVVSAGRFGPACLVCLDLAELAFADLAGSLHFSCNCRQGTSFAFAVPTVLGRTHGAGVGCPVFQQGAKP